MCEQPPKCGVALPLSDALQALATPGNLHLGKIHQTVTTPNLDTINYYGIEELHDLALVYDLTASELILGCSFA